MSLRKRIFGEGITYHITSNCNNNEFLFKTNGDFELFLKHLREAKNKFEFDLYGYQIMQSHIHLILKTNQHFLNTIMHWLCHGHAEAYNKLYERKGHFWRNRYYAKIIDNDPYGLGCLRYIHRNTLEAGIVDTIENWPWSCYAFYAMGAENNLITPLPSYLGLAPDKESRQRIYRKWVETPFLSKEMEKHLFSSKLRNNSIRQKRMIKKTLEPFLKNFTECA